MMMRSFLGLALMLGVVVQTPAAAQAPGGLTPDQKGYIAYDRCMMHAAIRASHTDAKDEDIFGIAKAECAATRAQVVAGQESNQAYLAALDAADADKEANFPSWIKDVRERRHARDTANGVPNSVPRQ
jgi:hypothetical protein